MTRRVVQWGTGWLGIQSVHTILAHPDVEMVGLFTATPEKEGKDVGELVGLPPVGITATSDIDEVLALGADCHVFMLLGADPETVEPAIEKIVRILDAGQNVATTSLIPMCYPKYAPVEMREPIAAACARGNARFWATGIWPGIVNDVLAVPFLACSERVDRVRFTEMFNYGEYYFADFARNMGIGGPMQDAAVLADALAAQDSAGHLAPAIRFVGDVLGVEIDEVRLADVAFAPAVERVLIEDLHIDGSEPLVVEPGSVGAYKLCFEGCVEGRPVIEFWFVTRWDPTAAPDWPAPTGDSTGLYRLEIEGSLNVKVDMNLMGTRDTIAQTRGFPTSSAPLGANLLGAGAVVNAIPFLCDAEPGLYGSMDLRRDRGLHVLRGG